MVDAEGVFVCANLPVDEALGRKSAFGQNLDSGEWSEGLAQNSEYRRRESLRQTVYRRYTAGQFWELDKLYGRNRYDNSLLIYHQGFSVVDFLIGRGGSLYFAAFMQQLVRTNDFDGCLRSFYGYRNIKELQAAWQAYIETGQNRATLPAVR